MATINQFVLLLGVTSYTGHVFSTEEGLIRSIVIRLGDDLAELKTGLLRLDEDLEELSLVLEESISEDGERQNDGIACNDLTGTLSYGGTISKTRSGRKCQRWSEQSPHEHKFTDDSMFPADRGVAGAENYCRDPDGEGMPWCYTILPWRRWEFCDIPICNHDCWYGDKSRLYHGTRNTTVTGKTCQNWADQHPHEHTNAVADRFPLDESVEAARNYCRDPDKSGEPWCYTTNPDVRWEYCHNRCGE